MVGRIGADILIGWGARDVLIGGGGQDQIDGWGGDDLLVAGATTFDLDPVRLVSIRAEWTSGRAYEERVSNLTGATNGGDNGDAVLTATTVFADDVQDFLTGGIGRDWFVTGAEDTVIDNAADEVRTIH